MTGCTLSLCVFSWAYRFLNLLQPSSIVSKADGDQNGVNSHKMSASSVHDAAAGDAGPEKPLANSAEDELASSASPKSPTYGVQLQFLDKVLFKHIWEHPFAWPFHKPVDTAKLNLPVSIICIKTQRKPIVLIFDTII